MEQLRFLAEALEGARLAVEQLAQTAFRARARKQLCHRLAHAAKELYFRLEAAFRERTIDVLTLHTAAWRLSTVANTTRERVEELGNPSTLGRLTATFFPRPRKNAARVLEEQYRFFLDIAEQYGGIWGSALQLLHDALGNGTIGSLATATMLTPANFRPRNSLPRNGSGISSHFDRVLSLPATNSAWGSFEPSSSLHIPMELGLFTHSPSQDASRPVHALNGLRLFQRTSGKGAFSDTMSLAPSISSGDTQLLFRPQFRQRSVRSSDGSEVQRLCFMRGAGGESAAVQLMVVFKKQIEVYSAALDSFHSETPLDREGQQVTAMALYEPTVDLITGHHCGTVLVYGRVSPALSSTNTSESRDGILSPAAAVGLAADEAGVPLIFRISRCAITALHCVPAIELEAATSATAAASVGASTASAAPNRSTGATATAGGPEVSNGSGGGTAPGSSEDNGNGGLHSVGSAATVGHVEASTAGSVGCCTADDVLLFTGDALGVVLAVRYSRVQPEILSTTVFSPSIRNEWLRNNGSAPQTGNSHEITALLYRYGCLLVSTATDIYSIRVLSGSQQPGFNNPGGNGNASGTGEAENGGAASGVEGSRPGATTIGGTMGRSGSLTHVSGPAGANSGRGFPSAGGRGGAAPNGPLPQSSSINLLSPASSALTARNSVAAHSGVATSGGGAGVKPKFRRGTLSLSTEIVDSFPFADFHSCTALVAIDWQVTNGSGNGTATAPGSSLSGGPSILGAPAVSPGIREPPGGSGAAAAVNNNAERFASVATSSGAAGSQARVPKFVAPRQGPWRMLSAHTNGQLLMWDLSGWKLQLICFIGQPGPPIINVFTFPELGTMIELLSTGRIRVGPLPTSALAPPMSPLGNVPIWQFQRAKLRAHRSHLTAGTALGNCIATGSRAGGVKIWCAAELRAQAARQGVTFLTTRPADAPVVSLRSSSGNGTAVPRGVTVGAGVTSDNALQTAPSATCNSPTGPGPYPLSDSYPLPQNGCATSRAVTEEPLNGVMPVGAPPASPRSAGIHAPDQSNGGVGYPDLFRVPSTRASSVSNMAVPPSSYLHVMGKVPLHEHDPYKQSYPVMPRPAGTNRGAGMGPMPFPPPQAGPSTSGLNGSELPLAVVPPPPHSQSPQRMPVSMLPPQAPAPRPVRPVPPMAASPFATGTDASDVPAVHRGGAYTGVGGAGPAVAAGRSSGGGAAVAVTTAGPTESYRYPLDIGSGLAGQFHAPIEGALSEGSDYLSRASSVGPNNPYYNHAHRPPQRSTQGLRPLTPTAGAAPQHPQQQPQVHQHQQGTNLARVLERPAGDVTPSRSEVPLSPTEELLKSYFTPHPNKLPTVGPVGINPDNLDVSQADITTSPKPGSDSAPSVLDTQTPLSMNVPMYAPPYPGGQYTAPQSPVLSRAPTPGLTTALLPSDVITAANDTYGKTSPLYSVYPDMPRIGTEALPQPPVHMPNLMPPGLGQGGVAMTSANKTTQVVPFTTDPRLSPGFHIPQPPMSQHYGSALNNNVAHGMYGRTSEYGVEGQQVLYGSGAGQHVPGPQISFGRRNSNLSENDTQSEAIYDAHDPIGDVGLPPPPAPFIRPPPVVTPSTPQAQDIQMLLSQNWFIRSTDLRNVEQIGEGAEGIVYRGRWHHADVAVKEMHPNSASFGHLASIAKDLSITEPTSASTELAGLIKEVAALIDLGQHPNIIRFIGICTAPPRIVTEYYKMGSLYSMLKEARQGNIRTREKLAWDKRLIMLKDIAGGMAYLHSCDYIHGDLRSPNVFVTEDQHLKIGDFGFARILGKAQNHEVPARLTNPRWQAPEVYDMEKPIATTAADVYSFGIIMYEMLTFRLPYDEEPEDEIVKLRHTFDPNWRPPTPSQRELHVQRNVRMEGHMPLLQGHAPVTCRGRCISLMTHCWAVDPESRPGFHKIANRLNAICHWQWALSKIMRSLNFWQRPRARSGNNVSVGGMGDASIAVPTYRAGSSRLSPASIHMLGPTVSPMEQSPVAERQLMDAVEFQKGALAGGLSGVPSSSTAAAPPLPPALPLLPPLPPLPEGVGVPLGTAATAVPPPQPLAAAPLLQECSEAIPAANTVRMRPRQFQGPPIDAMSARRGDALAGAPGIQAASTISKTVGSLANGNGSIGNGYPETGVRPAASARAKAAPLSQSRPGAAVASSEAFLETAPTLASTPSHPLRVPAAVPTSPRVSSSKQGVQAPAPAPAPAQPPLNFAGGRIDGHALMSPFQSVRLSDDDEGEPVAKVHAPVARIAAPAGPISAAYPAAGVGMTTAITPASDRTQGPSILNGQSQQQQQQQEQSMSAFAVAGAMQQYLLPAPRVPTVASGTQPELTVPGLANSLSGTGSCTTAPAAPLSASLLAVSSASSVELPVPPRVTKSPVAALRTQSTEDGLQGQPSFQPPRASDPLEMRTAFHMGIGFSIDDDDDD